VADIEKNVRIAAPIEKVWAALTYPTSIRGWMGDDSTIAVDLQVGGHYQLFGGETTGVFTQIEKPNKLAYTWRQGEWHKDWPDSLVSWELTPVGQQTQVLLTHNQFPNTEERDGHDEGWDIYFLGPMKEWLEANS
jgi:uncharacterized protein YndB with AHSA1/START domain